MDTNLISFPGLGIDPFEVTRHIGEGFKIYWYGIIITCGIICAFIYAMYRAKNERVDQDKLIDVALWTVILGVVGARLYYVAFNWSYYSSNLIDIFKIWEGGLAIHGGLLFGLLWIIIYTKKYKAPTLKILDMIVVGLISIFQRLTKLHMNDIIVH